MSGRALGLSLLVHAALFLVGTSGVSPRPKATRGTAEPVKVRIVETPPVAEPEAERVVPKPVTATPTEAGGVKAADAAKLDAKAQRRGERQAKKAREKPRSEKLAERAKKARSEARADRAKQTREKARSEARADRAKKARSEARLDRAKKAREKALAERARAARAAEVARRAEAAAAEDAAMDGVFDVAAIGAAGSRLKALVERNEAAWADAKERCEQWYGGIGVGIVSERGVAHVLEVYPGYAAAAAGLAPGDMLLAAPEIRGEPGSVLHVTVKRPGGAKRQVAITREKICLAGEREVARPRYAATPDDDRA